MGEEGPVSAAVGANGDPIQTLKDEHRATLLKLGLMERALEYLQGAPEDSASGRIEVEQALLKDLIVALERGMRVHFRKEEEALFPVLAEYVGKEYGPIEAMQHEHENIRTVFRHWKTVVFDFLERGRSPSAAAFRSVSESGWEAIRLLRQHIDKENQILFKICEVSLSEKEKKEVIEKMKRIGPDSPAPF